MTTTSNTDPLDAKVASVGLWYKVNYVCLFVLSLRYKIYVSAELIGLYSLGIKTHGLVMALSYFPAMKKYHSPIFRGVGAQTLVDT